MKLKQEHLDEALQLMGEDLRAILKDHPNQLIVAGGLLRAVVEGEDPTDVDVFVRDRKAMSRAVMRLNDLGWVPYTSPKAVTFRLAGRLPVQLIDRWPFDSPLGLIATFDYTMSQAALWHDGDDFRSVASPFFYEEVETKTLTFASPNRSDRDGDAVLRLLKFYRRGYRISLAGLADVLGRLAAPRREDEHEVAAVLLGKLLDADDSSDSGDEKAYLR